MYLCGFMLAESIISGWVALKLFLVSMSFLYVVLQTASSNAGKIANFAFMGLFSTVGELVSLQVLSSTEGLVALCTSVVLFSAMNFGMLS